MMAEEDIVSGPTSQPTSPTETPPLDRVGSRGKKTNSAGNRNVTFGAGSSSRASRRSRSSFSGGSSIKSFSSSNDGRIVFKTRSRQALELFYARLQEVLFDVLYLTTKDNAVYRRLATFGLGFDFLQLMAIALAPRVTNWGMPDFQYGFSAVSLPFTRSPDTLYQVFFWSFAGLVMLMLAMALFVGLSVYFNDGVLTQISVLVMLRFLAGMFVTILYIPAVRLFLSVFDCSAEGILIHTPEMHCWTTPQMPMAVVSSVILLLFVPFSLFVAFMVFDYNPVSRSLLARPNSRLELIYQVLKTVLSAMSLARSNVTTAVVLFVVSVFMAFWTVHFPPYFKRVVNQFRAGLFFAISVGSFIMVIITISGQESNAAGITFLVQLPFSFALGWFVCWWRVNTLSYYRVKGRRYQHKPSEVTSMTEADSSEHDTSASFRHPIYVEMCVRFLQTEHHASDIAVAKTVYKNALTRFDKNAMLHVSYLKFVQAYLPKGDSTFLEIRRQLSRTRHLPKWFDSKFCLFAIRREIEESSQGRNLGAQGMDVMTYVEFKKYHRIATRNAKLCKTWIKRFWKVLYENQSSFVILSNIVEQIARYENKAVKAYERLLHRFPASAPLLRSYGEFMETIFADYETADHCYELADELDNQTLKERSKNSNASTSGAQIGRASSDTSALEGQEMKELKAALGGVSHPSSPRDSDIASEREGSHIFNNGSDSSHSFNDSLGSRFRQLGSKRSQHVSPVVRNFLIILWLFCFIFIGLMLAWYFVNSTHFSGFKQEIQYSERASERSFMGIANVYQGRNVYYSFDRSTGQEVAPGAFQGNLGKFRIISTIFNMAHDSLFAYENFESRDYFNNVTGDVEQFPVVEFIPTASGPSFRVDLRSNVFAVIQEVIARTHDVLEQPQEIWATSIDFNRDFRFIMDNGARALPSLLLLGTAFHTGLMYHRIESYRSDSLRVIIVSATMISLIAVIFLLYWRKVRDEVGALRLFPTIPRRTLRELYERFKTTKEPDEAGADRQKKNKLRGGVTQKHYMTKVKQSLLRRSINAKSIVVLLAILVLVSSGLIATFGITEHFPYLEEITAVSSQAISALTLAHVMREAAFDPPLTWSPGEAEASIDGLIKEFKERRLQLAFGRPVPKGYDWQSAGANGLFFGSLRGSVNVPEQYHLFNTWSAADLELDFMDLVDSFVQGGYSDKDLALRALNMTELPIELAVGTHLDTDLPRDPSAGRRNLIGYYGASYSAYVEEARARVEYIWLVFQLIFWITAPLLVVSYIGVFLIKLGADLHEETRRTRRMLSLISVEQMNEPEMLALRTFLERSYVLPTREDAKKDRSQSEGTIHVDVLGNILSCNQGAALLLGSTEDKVVGTNLGVYLKEIDFDEMGDAIDTMDYEEAEQYKLRYPLGRLRVGGPYLTTIHGKRGRLTKATLYKGLLPMGAQSTYVYVLSDVESAGSRAGGGSQKEQLLWNLLELSEEGVMAVERTGKILFVNQATALMFKTVPSLLIGSELQKLIQPVNDDVNLLDETLAPVKVKGVDKKGQPVTADYVAKEAISGGKTVLAVTLRSTTQEALTMEQLRLWNDGDDGPEEPNSSGIENEYSKPVYEFDDDPVACITVDANMIICHLNKHAEKLFGYRHQDVRGEGLLNLVHSTVDSDSLLPPDKDNDLEKMIGDSMEVCGVRSQGGTIRMTMSIQRAASFHAEQMLYACLFTEELTFNALQKIPPPKPV